MTEDDKYLLTSCDITKRDLIRQRQKERDEHIRLPNRGVLLDLYTIVGGAHIIISNYKIYSNYRDIVRIHAKGQETIVSYRNFETCKHIAYQIYWTDKDQQYTLHTIAWCSQCNCIRRFTRAYPYA